MAVRFVPITGILLLAAMPSIAGRPGSRYLHPIASLSAAGPALSQISQADIEAEVVKVGSEYRLRVANQDTTNGFSGQASVTFGTSIQIEELARIKVSLKPGESVILPLRGASSASELYTLTITDQAGSIVLHKMAHAKSVTEATAPPPLPQQEETAEAKSTLKVKARIAGGNSENDPYVIAFEFSSPSPVSNAQLFVKAKGINDQLPVNFAGSTIVEVKLPDELEIQSITWKVIGSRGETLASGESDIAQLMNAEIANVADIRFDKSTYKPGDTAKVTVDFGGSPSNGVRVEVLAKDSTGNRIFRDIRKESRDAVLATLEFVVAIPPETKGPVVFEVKLFDSINNALLDSSTREFPIESK